VTSALRKFVLIGHPVGHSLSPAIHSAAYDELGVQGCRYVAVDCPTPADVAVQLDEARRGDVAGANVTVPWKRLSLESADEVHASAAATGAANVLRPVAVNGGGYRLIAHNTDVPALAEELLSGRPGARSATIIGSGGAALAAVVACKSIGVERIAVVARKFRGEQSTWPGAAALSERGATLLAWPDDAASTASLRRAFAQSDLVVQSTSDGMAGASDGTAVRDLVPFAELDRAAFLYDVVYNPSVTPFVAAARAGGLSAESGLGMLVGQAALAIELWLGKRPDPARLRAAAEAALSAKSK
jgi:shikimate dehydrogenase